MKSVLTSVASDHAIQEARHLFGRMELGEALDYKYRASRDTYRQLGRLRLWMDRSATLSVQKPDSVDHWQLMGPAVKETRRHGMAVSII